MTQCDTCGNDYDKPIEIRMHNKIYHFDCFECAVHKLAPTCTHCECKIIGHGMEANNHFYCCASCAKKSGERDLKDRTAH